jgi:hypothetical protein
MNYPSPISMLHAQAISNYTWQRVQVLMLFIMQRSPTHSYFIHLGSKYPDLKYFPFVILPSMYKWWLNLIALQDATEIFVQMRLSIWYPEMRMRLRHNCYEGRTFRGLFCIPCGFNTSNYTNTGCCKKSSTTLNAYINLFRGHVQCFELSHCSKSHRVLPEIVTV